MKQDTSLIRHREVLESANGAHIKIGDSALVNFSSNNYLDLANHPNIKTALVEAVMRYGLGSGGSQFISGYSEPLRCLEQSLADFFRRDRVILFSSGYLANQAVLTALADQHTCVIADKLIHASLLDAVKLSGAKLIRCRHLQLPQIQNILSDCLCERKIVLTEGVFSMDGRIAQLPELALFCKQQDLLLVVDDAHGVGVLGEQGAGVQAYFALNQEELPLLIGTFGKAFGLSGAFIAGPCELIETILQKGRSGMYTTALMPSVAAAAKAALGIIQSQHWRREKLVELIACFKEETEQAGLSCMSSETPIQAVVAGSNEGAKNLSQRLRAKGIYAPAIRTPTVPIGTERVRLSFTVGHEISDIKYLVKCLSDG